MNEELLMRRCLEIASRGLGHTGSNPMVGALLIHNGTIIAEGYHQQFGGPHAEVNCFNHVPEALKHLIPESTMFVTLEPCSHHGKTPPCALRIISEKVKNVIICNNDPNPLVNGRGISLLQEAGIEVKTGILAPEGRELNKRFFCFIEQQRPYVILKWAQTADGYIAPEDKSRFQITNQLSQRLLHQWRTEESAFLVGTTTAINDNPQLTSRLWDGPNPLRVVFDRELKIPFTHNIYDGRAKTLVFTKATHHPEIPNTTFANIEFDSNLPFEVLKHLKNIGISSVVVEGGEQTINSFMEAGLWDEARIFESQSLLHKGIPAPILNNYKIAGTTHLGDNTLTTAYRIP